MQLYSYKPATAVPPNCCFALALLSSLHGSFIVQRVPRARASRLLFLIEILGYLFALTVCRPSHSTIYLRMRPEDYDFFFPSAIVT